MTRPQAVVIGGGFFGCAVAIYLAKERGFDQVSIVERENRLLSRASLYNQARVHGGYHYPRDHLTARRSRITRDWFRKGFPDAIQESVTSIYALAAQGSQVNTATFVKRMERAGAKLAEPTDAVNSLFNQRRIAAVFQVEEDVFDANVLRGLVQREISDLGIKVEFESNVVGLEAGKGIEVRVEDGGNHERRLTADYVFNCTYAGLNKVARGVADPVVEEKLKHEVAELLLVSVPEQIEGLAITVMDGPFFSLMPYPPLKSYSLSHVRYTPRESWIDDPSIDPYQKLSRTEFDGRSYRMLKDASQFVPLLSGCAVTGSFRELKTVLVHNEVNDGRPILLERSLRIPGLFSILGGKIDNVFDVFEFLSRESFIGTSR